MREIIFRGKSKILQKWVYGYFTEGFYTSGEHVSWIEDITNGETESYVVDPETVGQYTGLTDKNGNKIYEGDILATEWEIEHKKSPYYHIRFALVKYGEFNCRCCNGVYGFTFDDGDIRDYEAYQIIGNIYDNPELIRKVEE